MYESEANNRSESIDQIPVDVLAKFQEFRSRVLGRTLLPWGEHCTECAWPACYTTCDLYSARPDGKCQRFLDGMVRLDCPGAVNTYILKIRFKRWGKLWGPGNIQISSLATADELERRDQAFASSLHHIPLPQTAKKFATNKRYSWKKRAAEHAEVSSRRPNLFAVECYNPGKEPISLSLTIRPTGSQVFVAFQKLITVPARFHRELIPVQEIAGIVDLSGRFSVDLTPNDIDEGTTLYFGMMDFIEATADSVPAPKPRPSVKCVVWDLDNTIWNGILVEDGIEKLVLKDGITDIFQRLDARGILQSIASKNDYSDAMEALKRWGIDEYFLHPQISWNPKSEGLKNISSRLNIGIDTLLFIDDSPFELEQVSTACPEVRTLAADRYVDLPNLECCQVPVTAESKDRRKMYQQEVVRESAALTFGDNYLEFLRDCQITLRIERLSAANLERVHELTQRTNQMNFSGRRYERNVLEQVAVTTWLDTYVISCQDRFGSYGIVGFSIVDTHEPRMTDLMFSCRVQSKRVEHAILTYLIRKYRQAANTDFRADYRKTPRNAPSGRVFEDVGMTEESERDGLTSLVFPRDAVIPDDGIIRVVENGPAGVSPSHAYSPASR